MKKKNKLGFTLIEMLVVVLIIGILAGIALPQYNKAVEKARLPEALVNIRNIEGSLQRYILANGLPSETIYFKDIADVELSSGEWDDDVYNTKHFAYCATVSSDGYHIEVYRRNGPSGADLYTFYIDPEQNYRECVTQEVEMGRYICKYLESQGWTYADRCV